MEKIVSKEVMGKPMYMGESHMLPFYTEKYKFYDRAIIRLSNLTKKFDGYLKMIDVGANIGDTVELVSRKTTGDFLCFEGDKEYIDVFKKNVQDIKDCKIVLEECFLSDKDERTSNFELEKINGTAVLVNSKDNKAGNQVEMHTLDSVLKTRSDFNDSNFIKIDTDGFEIQILKGSEGFLKAARPNIFIEFNPDEYVAENFKPTFIFEFLSTLGYEDAIFYDNFGEIKLISKITELSEISKLISLIDHSTIYYYDIFLIHSSKKTQIEMFFKAELLENISYYSTILKELNSKIETKDVEIQKINSEFATIQGKILILEQKINDLNAEISENKLNFDNLQSFSNSQKKAINSFKISNENLIQRSDNSIKVLTELNQELTLKILKITDELEQIRNSKKWRYLISFERKINFIFPKNSLQRKFVSKLLGLIRKNGNQQSDVNISTTTSLVNKVSNKIVYVGHSYHSTTKSTTFLIDLLKEYFDVDVILDNSWRGDPPPDLSFIDESYKAVVFFQQIPPADKIKDIKNQNIIFFPMYDNYNSIELEYWKSYKDLKIINFSSTLNTKLLNWNLKSMYIQYFPTPREYSPGDINKLFFWQRVPKINFELIKTLLGNFSPSVHIHVAPDPGAEYLKPSKEDEIKYNISTSEWKQNREEVFGTYISERGLYMAPRVMEGIGLSFLEAMSAGKAVIAPNNPTMNEYIVNGETGYLYDIDNPKQIDFGNIKDIQLKTYKYMLDGFEKWEENKIKIINFILEK